MQTASRAHRVPVATEEPLIGTDRYDYADAFEIRLAEPDPRSAEEFARSALEGAPWWMRRTVLLVHRYVLRVRLGPRSSPDHILGWKIQTSEPDVLQLVAESALLGRGAIIGRSPDPSRRVITTYLFHTRPALARAVWKFVGPLHRRVAPDLLNRAAARSTRDDHPTAVDA
jgi:hypothetical protein